MLVLAYPGSGKTFLAENFENVSDLEFQHYRWDYGEHKNLPLEKLKGRKDLRTNNPEWPNNFFKLLDEELNKNNIILVPMATYLLSPYSKAILKIPNSTKEAMNFINEQNLNVERVEMTENESKIVCSGYLENIYELQKKIKKLTSGFGKIEVSHEGFKRYYKDTDLTFSADSSFNEENFIINVMKGSLPNLDKQPRRKAKVKYSQRTKDWYQQG